MKKVIITSIALLCLQLVSSQFKGGYTIGASTFTLNSDVLETSSQVSPLIGIHARYILDEKSEIFVETSINLSKYSVAGTEFFENSPVGPREVKFKTTPVIAGFYYNYNIIGQNFSIFAGPSFSVSFSNKVKEDIDGVDIRFGDLSEGIDSGLSASQVLDLSPYLYLSAGISGGTENFKIRLKYDYGLSNAYDDVRYDFGSKTLEGKTSLISLAIFYSFDLM